MNICVIGAGSIGLNIAYELLAKGNHVTIYTKSLQSVSAIYASGIILSSINFNWARQVYFENQSKNYTWFILYLVTMIYYMKVYDQFKLQAIKASERIMKKRNIQYPLCNKNYFLDFMKINNQLVKFMKNNPKFKIIYKTISDDEIKNLSKKYTYVFDCRGSNTKCNRYCRKIGGYKITILANKTEKCFIPYDGWFIHSDRKNKNQLILKGGFVIGSEIYEGKIIDKNHFNKISNFIKKSDIWKKYDCEEILEIRMGTRSYSIDMLPYYEIDTNIIHIAGISAVGCILAPYITKNIIDRVVLKKKKYDFDLSIHRVQMHYQITRTIIMLIIVIILYFITNTKLNIYK